MKQDDGLSARVRLFRRLREYVLAERAHTPASDKAKGRELAEMLEMLNEAIAEEITGEGSGLFNVIRATQRMNELEKRVTTLEGK